MTERFKCKDRYGPSQNAASQGWVKTVRRVSAADLNGPISFATLTDNSGPATAGPGMPPLESATARTTRGSCRSQRVRR